MMESNDTHSRDFRTLFILTFQEWIMNTTENEELFSSSLGRELTIVGLLFLYSRKMMQKLENFRGFQN